MKIYRIEHNTQKELYFSSKLNIGPFTTAVECHPMKVSGSTIYDEVKVVGESCRVHPEPWEDNYRGYSAIDIMGYFCAFYNLHNLLQWFPCKSGRAAMKQYGFEIKVIESTRTIAFLSQVLFHEKDFKVVDILDLETFEKRGLGVDRCASAFQAEEDRSVTGSPLQDYSPYFIRPRASEYMKLNYKELRDICFNYDMKVQL